MAMTPTIPHSEIRNWTVAQQLLLNAYCPKADLGSLLRWSQGKGPYLNSTQLKPRNSTSSTQSQRPASFSTWALAAMKAGEASGGLHFTAGVSSAVPVTA